MRPFKILGVQQIAIGSTDKESLIHFWQDILGVSLTGKFRSESENVDEDIAKIGKGAAEIEIDLMTPIDADKKPAVHIPPLNHIGLWVDDLQSCVQWLMQQGVRFTPGGIRKGASGYDVCFIHPKGNDTSPLSGQGILIELVQAPDDIIKSLS